MWQNPPKHWLLSTDEIHVWCTSTDQPHYQIDKLAQILSEDEIKRAHKFHFEQHRNRFIIARGVLRMLLGRYLDISPSKLEFYYSDRGKPSLKEKISFNLSHSEDLVIYAITLEKRIGVDIEYIRAIDNAEQIAKRFFSAREYAAIKSLGAEQQQIAFFNCWTRKEAYLKAIGEGLAHSLDKVEVTLLPGEPAQILSIDGHIKAAHNWFLQELTPNSQYVAALAVEGKNWQVKCWQLSELSFEY